MELHNTKNLTNWPKLLGEWAKPVFKYRVAWNKLSLRSKNEPIQLGKAIKMCGTQNFRDQEKWQIKLKKAIKS